MTKKSVKLKFNRECSSILDEIEQGAWVVEGNNYQMVYANKAAGKLYDRPQEELLENPNLWLEVTLPEDRDRLLQCLAKISETGKQEIEYRIQKAKGEIRLIKNKLWAVKSDVKNPYRINGIIEEISPKELNGDRCKEVAKNLPAVIYQYILHPDGSDEFSYVSPGVRELFELEPEEIIKNSQRIWELIPEEDVELMRLSIARSAQNLTEWEERWRVKTPSGTIKWMSGISRPQKQTNGDIVWDGFLRDISDRKQIEGEKTRLITSLAESEARYRSVLSALSEGIVLQDSSGAIYACNDSAESILGTTAEQMMGRTSTDPRWRAIKEDGSPIPAEEYPNSVTLRTGKPFHNVIMGIQKPDGSLIWISVNTQPLFRPKESTPYASVASFTDISDRKEAETALLESEERFRNLVETTSDWIWSADLEWNYTYVSPQVRKILGYSPEEVLGRTPFDFMSPTEGRRSRYLFQSLTAAQQPLANIETINLRKDGCEVVLETSAVPVFDLDGNFGGYCGIARDISDRKRSEARNRAMLSAMPDLLFRLSKEGKILDFKAPNIFDLPLPNQEFIGKNIADILPDEVARSILRHTELALTTGKMEVFEYQLPLMGDRQECEARVAVVENSEVLAIVRDITDRKRAEVALQQSERRFRALFDSMFQFMALLQPDGTVLEANQTCLDFFGIQNSDAEQASCLLTGQPFWTAPRWLPENRVLVKESIHRAAKGNFIRYELDLIGVNSSLATIDFSIKPFKDETGKVVMLIAEGRDLTERKQAEIERDRFFTVSLDLLCIAGFDGYFKRINPSWPQLFGYSEAELLSRPFIEFTHPEDVASTLAEFEDLTKLGKTVIKFENRYRAKDGSYKWLAWTSVPFVEEGLIYGVARDISDRKQAELALQKSEAQFRQLAKREALIDRIGSQIRNSLELDTILETTVRELYNLLEVDVCSFAWYQSDRNCWEVTKEVKKPESPSFLGDLSVEVLGSLSEKLLQMEIYQVEDVSTVSDPIVRKFLVANNITSGIWLSTLTSSGVCAVACTRASSSQPWKNEEIQLLDAVSDRLAIAINQAELYQQSRLSAIVATAKSQELEETLRQLRRTQSQLVQAEKMSSLGQMVAGIAHEINNPVNFIFGNVNFAGDYIKDILELVELYQIAYPEPTPEIQETLESIDLEFLVEDLHKLLKSMKVGAERIREIVKSLRTFSRLDEAEIKEIDLHENIDSTLLILQNRLKSKLDRPAIRVIKEYSQLPLVECYAGPLNQVFMNIIANAIDALEERDKNRTRDEINADPGLISITTVAKDNLVEIRLMDNGIGMSQKAMEKIFDPFYTTKPIGKGTGLGLSISYQIIVDKHGGELRCISEEGKGTEFIIVIPLKNKKMTL